MNTGIKIALGFAGGLLAGAGIGGLYFKQLYQKRADEEIRSVKAVYTFRKPEEHVSEGAAPEKKAAKAVKPAPPAGPVDYTRYAAPPVTPAAKPEDAPNTHYIIPPADFSMEDDYESASLILYRDGVLSDSDDRALKESEIEDLVGLSSLNHFGEYEEDSVFVRNDRLKMDFEIIRDPRTYQDAIAQDRPYRKEDE